MSDLSVKERMFFERLLQMGDGYVLNFSNDSMRITVMESTGKDIYAEEYGTQGNSKANRIRTFCEIEPNHIVGKLLGDLLACAQERGYASDDAERVNVCQRVVDRLLQGVSLEDLDALAPEGEDATLDMLAGSVRESIQKGEPEAGLDRLHAFSVRFMRKVLKKRGIDRDLEEPLHSLMGKYVKIAKREGLIESTMTERILKSSISTLDAYNEVRNNKSLAHDNEILNYEESTLICSHTISVLRFVDAQERAAAEE